MSIPEQIIFQDDFAVTPDHAYPANWQCDQAGEKPFLLAGVIGREFCLFTRGNRHIPRTPPLRDFTLEFDLRGDIYCGRLGIELLLRYDPAARSGWLLRYHCGVSGNQTNVKQRELAEYECELLRYDGRRAFGKCQPVAAAKIPGFIRDLSVKYRVRLLVHDERLEFFHGGAAILAAAITAGAPDAGCLAFDQSRRWSGWGGAPRISALTIAAKLARDEQVLRPETCTAFPAGPNGIISPYYFHTAVGRVNGLTHLRLKLTGGPAKAPVYPDIDRYRLNEKMFNPYVRLESAAGRDLGRFLLAKGSAGLAGYHWNVLATSLLPADHECPMEREVVLDDWPAGVRIFIGYEKYIAEDSIGNTGGPTEALLDAGGNVVHAGPVLRRGDVQFEIISPPDKQVCARIPPDLPRHAAAMEFARRNHFFCEGEPVRFAVTLYSRDASLEVDAVKAAVRVEDVFGDQVGPGRELRLHHAPGKLDLAGARVFSTGWFALPVTRVGVYHLRVRLAGAGTPEQRRAFEIMPAAPDGRSAQLASGLPELCPCGLAGILNEHFNPWSPAVADTAHYNNVGNNFYKVAREWRAPELLRAYRRKWFCRAGAAYATLYGERGIAPNRDLIAQADMALAGLRRADLRFRAAYKDEFVFQKLLEFLGRPGFARAGGGELNHAALAAGPAQDGLTPAQFQELVACHWKSWLIFFAAANEELGRASAREILAINPRCEPSYYGIYPVYAAPYKSGGYFPLQFGLDLRRRWSGFLPGAAILEDYPYSSGYPMARGIYALATCKLEDPQRKIYPEMFGLNGETADPRPLMAFPPLGRSNPPPGYLLKQFYEYCFASVWFDRAGFHNWTDHGYSPKTWSPENYRELLYAYAFVNKVKPARPLRTTAFVFSRAACLAHPDYWDADEELCREGSVINTAEEAAAFAYEQARQDGQLAGFVVKMEDLEHLPAAAADMLVLPPLCGVSDAAKAVIRKLHEQGAGLLGFEDVSGLEDLFGVTAAPAVSAGRIFPGAHPAAAAWDGMRDEADHPLCVIRHRATTAQILLASSGGLPALTVNDTAWGRAAFWALPPTCVSRARALGPTNGQVCNSDLAAAATRLAMRLAGNKEAETNAGVLIGFRDADDHAHVIVAEDRHPAPGRPIRPLVRIKIPGIKPEHISSDKQFEIVAAGGSETLLRFALAAHESVRIRVAM